MMMYDAMSLLRVSGVGAVLLYASMPLAIYPAIALGTLGIQQCTSARMMSSYSVRSFSVNTFSVGKKECNLKLRLTFGKNWDEKRKKHFQQMRQEASNQGVKMPKKFKDNATEQAQKDMLDNIIKNGEQRQQKYMTFDNAIWSKSGDSIVIQKADGEFLTYLRYSQGGAAVGWNGGHK